MRESIFSYQRKCLSNFKTGPLFREGEASTKLQNRKTESSWSKREEAIEQAFLEKRGHKMAAKTHL